jgi:hypothetical protein
MPAPWLVDTIHLRSDTKSVFHLLIIHNSGTKPRPISSFRTPVELPTTMDDSDEEAAVVLDGAEAVIDHAELKERIKQCERIDEFEQVYDSAAFQRTLRTIRVAQGVAPVDEWSKDWAIRMRAEAAADVELNECRRTALNFVYELCNRWKDDECEDVTDESLVKEFKGHRLINILQLVLPMDRAQALYRMIYPFKAAYGMHWVSELQAAQPVVTTDDATTTTTWGQLVQAEGGIYTMNKRYLWLMDLPGLGLQQSAAFQRWTTPTRTEFTAAGGPSAP